MKTSLTVKNAILLTAFLFVLLSCEKDGEIIEELTPTDNPVATEINRYIKQLPDCKTDSIPQTEPVLKAKINVPTETDPYQCDTYEKTLVRSLQDIIAVETNPGMIWPGALIQGKTLETGELQLINARRAPITLQTNLPLSKNFQVVDEPNSVKALQAIADFQIAAGQLPNGSEAGAGQMNFSVEEAASFEQSMLAMGISGGFTEPQSQIGLDASANVSVERSYREHTVIAKFMQKMFTVRLADDLLAEPADFFPLDFSESELQNLKEKGELGADNLPLYIESVTYGRIMLFTMKSTSVTSAENLSAALQASMNNYANAGGELTQEQQTVLENSSATIYSAGGTKDAANAAIANLNWSEFFKAAPATTAVPISFVAKTLNGKRIVKIVDAAQYVQRDNCRGPSSYEVTVTWTNNDYTGACQGGVCPQQVFVKPVSANVGPCFHR